MSATIAEGFDEQEYHRSPGLSQSGIKLLLDSPARYAYAVKHPTFSKTFDVGHAAHAKVLGTGAEVAVIPEDICASNGATSTKAAKEFIAEARKAGLIPLKADVVTEIDAMAEALLEHGTARAIMESEGKAELSMKWETGGTVCRGRVDWATSFSDGTPVLVDYKTCLSAAPRKWQRSVVDYGYDSQAAWYMDGWGAITGERPWFGFIIQEKGAPYLVAVRDLDSAFIMRGQERNQRGLEIYRECKASGLWPGYTEEIETTYLPAWA